MIKHWINIGIFAVSILIILFFFRTSEYFLWLLLGSFLIFWTILSIGVLFLKANYFLSSTTKLPGQECLLTFDDGPDPDRTPKILEILKKHDIRAVFFVIGKKVQEHPEIVQQIVDEGHLIGNHSYDHHNFMSIFERKRLFKDIKTAQDILTPFQEVKIFRPPIGYTNPEFARVLKKLQLKCIGWRLRSYDSVYKQPERLKQRILTKIKPGDIVLFHDNLEVTNKILDTIIQEAKQNGIIFVSGEQIKTVLNA